MGAPVNLLPQVVSSGIGALGSLASTFLNQSLNKESMYDQMKISKDLMNYQWQNFQSPGAIVKSLAGAGVNPAAAFGEGKYSVSSPSVSMPSSTPAFVGGIESIGSFVKAMADAKKAGLDSVGKQIENDFQQKTLDDRIKAVSLQNNWTAENTAKVTQEIAKTTADLNMMQIDADIKRIDLSKHEDLINWQLQQFKDKHNLDDQQFKALSDQLPVILDKLKHEEKLLGLEEQIQGDFKATMANLGVVGQVVQVLGNILKFFK